MSSELKKLSPYRIFELLSQRNQTSETVAQGIALLKEMFSQRGGIDGEHSDESGLNVDEFLHFVQQIRDNLTAQEQEELFAQEAQRSSVARYLAACAGIARGFADLEPHYIRKGQHFLQQLAPEHGEKENRADVYLEESICALLLGETDTALDLIEKSQETDAIAQIQAYSAEAGETSDLLLGLCRYCEEWLESVLFPKFLDLKDASASLKDYFASESVQQTLESFQNPEPVSLEEQEKAIQTNFFSQSQGDSAQNRPRSDAPEKEPSHTGQSAVQHRRHSRPKRRSRLSSKVSGLVALLLVAGVGLGAIALVIFGAYQGVNALWSWVAKEEQTPKLQSPPLALELNAAPVGLPDEDTEENATETALLNRDRAEEIVRTWLNRKAQALGPEHRTEALNSILTAPLLSGWQNRAQTFANRNSYQQFRHSVTIESLSYRPNQPNQGQITAQVREVAKFYRNGNQIQERSYDSTLKVRYDVIRENQTWRINGITVTSDQ